MSGRAHLGSLFCILTLVVGIGLLAAPTETCAADDQKAAPTKSAPPHPGAGPAPEPETLQIIEFKLNNLRPNPTVTGSTTLGDFSIGFAPSAAVDARSAIRGIVNRLRVVIDDRIHPVSASIISINDSPDSSRRFAYGEFALTVRQGAIEGAFLGVHWGDDHSLFLIDPESDARSNRVGIAFLSPWYYRWGVAGGLPILIVAYGFGGWWWFAARRRRMLPELPRADDSPSPGAPAVPTFVPRPTLPPPEPPTQLLAALSEGRAMLVLGGGASAQAGYPSSAELLDQLLHRLRARLSAPFAESLRTGIAGGTISFGKVMDALASGVPREQIAAEIDLILGGVRGDSDFHDSLAELPWSGVLSLTWDNFARQIFTQRRWSQTTEWLTFALDETAQLPKAARGGQRLFLRPLGDLSRPASLSLSMEEFRRNLLRWPEFQRQLGLLLQTQSFMFIGVGRDTLEQFMLSIGTDLEVADERHFALIPDSAENGLLGATLKRFGLRILPYTTDVGHTAVVRFVDEMVRSPRVRAGRRAGAGAPNNEFANSKIEGVTLKNIGLFDELTLKFQTAPISPPESAAAGRPSELSKKPSVPWTVIFGPNGCGKSSILRAIGLAFCGTEAQTAAGRLLQAGKSEGSIEVQFGSQVLRTRLVRDRNDVIVSSGQVSPVQGGLALVLGFPALRGGPSGNPRGVAAVDARGPEPADLLPMINGEVDRRLGNFKQWLVNVLEQAGRGEQRAVAMKVLLDGIIRDVVPGEFKKLAPLDASYVIRIKIDDSEKASPSDLPFDDLSQGMTSIFNWLGVLAQRLYDFYPDADKPEAQSAVVMIDEIDAHLHPDWQRRLVELAKKFFPNVQVLATSHSPLLAGALRGKELCVLERDLFTRKVAPLSVEIDTYGMRSQLILTSPIFGLSSDRNPDLEQRIKRHVELVETLNPSLDDKRELEKLTAELQNFKYAGARPIAKPDQPTQKELEILRERFGQTAAEAAVLTRPGEKPLP